MAPEPNALNGMYPNNSSPAPCTWQFNFKFSLTNDMYAEQSTNMLSKAGLDFNRFEQEGIDPEEFGSLLISSGLVIDEDVHWISFHAAYDFGYLMKVMLCQSYPETEQEFQKLLRIYFPSAFDTKYIHKHVTRYMTANGQSLTDSAKQVIMNLRGKSGLQDIAEELGVKRVGIAHQAGSDSLMTGEIFFKIRRMIFNNNIDAEMYAGQIWGLNGVIPPPPAGAHQTPNLNGATIYSNGNTPSTPNTAMAGMNTHTPGPNNHTPGPHHQNTGRGALTPGAGGGVFGGFQYTQAA